ncbi:hypothetical protein Val02_39600 [Virgisporangium aliadipatigenens]|uniref:Uncharacterized protein n=1 Tax=Virgisporangium aliadipatigenens TaxID=741659 RepID=A0A8J3YKL4_9ACTN|nr:hypothetical protein [Virgisporangium aliadipatigenens]GIJ47074.1 hypothetical protein Val02_39600 [Virgisporangium aliadipatigenens]
MSYHVRDVLETVQGAPPPPRRTSTDDIIATARRMRARRTAAAAVSGTAAVIAVMVAAVAVLNGPAASTSTGTPVGAAPSASAPSDGTEPEPLPEFRPVPSVADVLPHVPASDPLLTIPTGFRTVFDEYRAGEYRIGPAGQVATDRHELPVYREGLTWKDDDGTTYPMSVGSVTFYRAGVYDPARLGAEEPTAAWGDAFGVTVAGRAGIGRETAYRAAGGEQGTEIRRTAVAWQYAPDSWATYVPRRQEGAQSRDDAIRIAAAVTAKPARDIRLPFRIGNLPNGWQVVAATETPDRDSSTISEVYLHRGALPADKRAAEVTVDLPVLRIAAFHGEPKNESIRNRNGVHCHETQPSCAVVAGAYFIEVEGRFAEGMTVAEVRQFVNGLIPVNFADRATWVPVGG